MASLGLSDTQIRAALASSFMVSADNAHAVHPNHPEKYDELNRTFMNGGVVIKHNANQKYTTDAVSDAIFAEICAKAGVPVQHFANRSDVLGGPTLGNLANEALRMKRMETHQVFDSFWKERGMSRTQGYKWMAKKLRLSEELAHIGGFEMDRCQKLIRLCEKERNKAKKKEAA